ncbi:MAG: hypothetical protein L0Y58_02080 [Verrucomicrobia subdivision 3 bacterium]|nr:hypothetical protein [Limisphaerales bacterium]
MKKLNKIEHLWGWVGVRSSLSAVKYVVGTFNDSIQRLTLFNHSENRDLSPNLATEFIPPLPQNMRMTRTVTFGSQQGSGTAAPLSRRGAGEEVKHFLLSCFPYQATSGSTQNHFRPVFIRPRPFCSGVRKLSSRPVGFPPDLRALLLCEPKTTENEQK